MNMERCSETALSLGESIAGTALSQTTHWIMLEHRGQWARKAIETPGLSDAERAHLKHALETVENSRLQLIRRPKQGTESLRLFLGVSTRTEQRLHEISLSEPGALCDVDLVSILDGTLQMPTRNEPLYLVCCHGKRDLCCARQGMPVFAALNSNRGDAVWQTTHLGGHRFAATLMVLPQGHHYGRVRADEVDRLVQGEASGQIYDLARFRGWTAQPRAAQAADAWLRQSHPGVEVRWEGSADEQHHFSVDGRPLSVTVRSEPTVQGRPFSCGEPTLRHPPIHHCSEVSG